MKNIILSIVLPWTLFLFKCDAYSVTASNSATDLANAIFSGAGINVVSASYSGATAASGTFTEGPFGIGSGAILTTGTAVGSLPNGDHYVNNGQSGSDTYCGVNTFNAAILSVDVIVDVGYSGILVEFVFASEEEGGSPDPMGVFIDNTNYAENEDGSLFTATSPWLSQPGAIVPPNSVTSYPGSSPLLDFVMPASAGAHTIVFAICDKGDAEWDSAILIKASGSTESTQTLELDYVTSTVAINPPAVESTETIKASGTVSGTLIISEYATTTEIASTTDSPTTTTTAPETSTTVSETTTFTSETTTAAPETTTTFTETTMATTTFESTTETTTIATSETATYSSETSTTALETTTVTSKTTTFESTTETTAITTSETTITTTFESTTESDSTTSETTLATTSESTFTTIFETTLTTVSSSTSYMFISSSTTSSIVDPTTEVTTSQITTLVFDSTSPATYEVSSTETQKTTESTNTVLSTDESTTGGQTTTPANSSFESSTATTTTETTAASNIPNFNMLGKVYKYTGCVGSSDGYPSFSELATEDDMTTAKCMKLGAAASKKYVGLHKRSCYVSDQLDAVGFLKNADCDIPCPGDPGLLCGGDVASPAEVEWLGRRSFALNPRISINILLTLYELVENASTAAATTATEASSTGEPSSTIPSGETTVVVPFSTFTSNGVLVTLHSTLTVDKPVTRTTTTTLTVATTATSVAYTTVDPNDRVSLVVTEVSITIEYYPCPVCANNGVPPIGWTNTEAPCEACGLHGEDHVTLRVPKVGFCTLDTQTAAGERLPVLGQWLQYAPDGYEGESHPTLPVETKVYKFAPTNMESNVFDVTTRKGSLYTVMTLQPTGIAGALKATDVTPKSPVTTDNGKSSEPTEAPSPGPTSPLMTAGGNKGVMEGLRLLIMVTIAIIFITVLF